MSHLICMVDLGNNRTVELDNGAARYWEGTALVFHGLIDSLPEAVIRQLVELGVLVRTHTE